MAVSAAGWTAISLLELQISGEFRPGGTGGYCDPTKVMGSFESSIREVTLRHMLIVCLAFGLSVGPALASDVIALGASNTLGRGKGAGHGGVDRAQAYPAQLEAMLRQRGCKARVVNAGVAGDTPSGMAARLPKLLTKQTKVVVLQPGGNDSGPDRASAMARIEQLLADRGIALVTLERPGQIAHAYQLPDGLHFSAEGHTAFASYLLPKVVSAGACS